MNEWPQGVIISCSRYLRLDFTYTTHVATIIVSHNGVENFQNEHLLYFYIYKYVPLYLSIAIHLFVAGFHKY